MAYTFDGQTRIIQLSNSTTLDVKDLYSRWKDWLQESENSKWPTAFSTAGGEDISISDGTKIPPYIFLENGWRVRPYSASYTLNVKNGILLVYGGGDPFIDTIGSYIVRINYQQPVQAISYEAGGSSDILDETNGVENNITVREALRLLIAVAVGKDSITPIEGGATVKFRDTNDTKDRIIATMSGSQRTSVSLDKT